MVITCLFALLRISRREKKLTLGYNLMLIHRSVMWTWPSQVIFGIKFCMKAIVSDVRVRLVRISREIRTFYPTSVLVEEFCIQQLEMVMIVLVLICMNDWLIELWICDKCGKSGYFADEKRLIEDEQCYSLLIWLQYYYIEMITNRTDDGYSYKKTSELYTEYQSKCTTDNYLYIRLLQYLLTYFIALNVWMNNGSYLKRSMECEEISQTLLQFMNKYQIHYSRALIQEVCEYITMSYEEYLLWKVGFRSWKESLGYKILWRGIEDVRWIREIWEIVLVWRMEREVPSLRLLKVLFRMFVWRSLSLWEGNDVI